MAHHGPLRELYVDRVVVTSDGERVELASSVVWHDGMGNPLYVAGYADAHTEAIIPWRQVVSIQRQSEKEHYEP